MQDYLFWFFLQLLWSFLSRNLAFIVPTHSCCLIKLNHRNIFNWEVCSEFCKNKNDISLLSTPKLNTYSYCTIHMYYVCTVFVTCYNVFAWGCCRNGILCDILLNFQNTCCFASSTLSVPKCSGNGCCVVQFWFNGSFFSFYH